MEFVVEVNSRPHRAAVVFAELSDLLFVERWRETLGESPAPVQRESVDLAHLARERAFADSKVGQPYVSTSGDIREHVARDQHCEVAGLVLLTCDWFNASDVIGFCHFRRTWCNNLAIDYLGKHPLTLGNSGDPRYNIKGIGPALLCFLSRVGVELSSNNLWGEATKTSWGFYKKLFALDSVQDLFLIPQQKFAICADMKLDWQASKELNANSIEAAKELFEAEIENPPLVGNRTLMVGSRRELVEHFLDLPRHSQNEVAKILGLLNEGDEAILEDQWGGVLFQRATQTGKLRELWNEVEKRHEHGHPENNPFAS